MADPAAVLDTAPLVAYLAGHGRGVGRVARRFFDRARQGRVRLLVPTVCLFEVAQLEERGRVSLDIDFQRWCEAVVAAPPLLVVPLERSHVTEARALPALRDPFDRLIAGTAVASGLPLLTADDRIAESGRVRVLW